MSELKTYIATKPGLRFVALPERQEFDDGTVIESLFGGRVLIIRTANEEVADWFSAELDVTPDDFYLVEAIPNDSYFDRQWAHKHDTYKSNNTYKFWDKTGLGGTSERAVCIIDTGIASHGDLDALRITVDYDGSHVVAISINGNGEITKHTSLSDTTQYIHPHGTHVAGIACGRLNNAKGIAGVYSNKIFSINVFEYIYYGGKRYLGAYISSILKALDFVEKNSSYFRTVNLSLGGGYTFEYYNAYKFAFEALASKEIIVCVAAGNSGYDVGVWKPLPAYAKVSNMFTVASMDVNGVKSWFSNYNRMYCETMVAGGSVLKALETDKFEDDDILSTLPADADDDVYNSFTDISGDRYGYMAGTSMASPYLCGLINILYELFKTAYPSDTFSQRVERIRKAVVGASYLHTRDAFEEVESGGAFDCDLLDNELICPEIVNYGYNAEEERLKIIIKNTTDSPRDVYVSACNARFKSPLEISEDLLAETTVSFVGGEEKEVNLAISSNNWFSCEKVGVLVAYVNGNNVQGYYAKKRYYNIFDCPIPTCSGIQIRCDDEDYLPLKVTNYPLSNAGLLSTLAERAQKRLLFFTNASKENNKYIEFIPVATNGVCLNTINYPFATHQFQVREDATKNDMLYAYYSIYVQLRKVYEEGIPSNGHRWFVFDFEYWRQEEKKKYRRLKLPDKYKLNPSDVRYDKIGLIIEAINWMIYKSKVLFAVDIELFYYKLLSDVYVKRNQFTRDFDGYWLATYPFRTDVIFPNSLYPLTYYDSQGRLRVRWDSRGDPFKYVDVPNSYIYLGESGIYHLNGEGNVDYTYSIVNIQLEHQLFYGIYHAEDVGLMYIVTGSGEPSELNLPYYYGAMPLTLRYVDENPNITYETIPEIEDILTWTEMVAGTYFIGMYTDKPITLTGGTLDYTSLIVYNDDPYQACYHIFATDKYGIDAVRLVAGEFAYVTHSITCNAEVEIPIAFEILLNTAVSKHKDSVVFDNVQIEEPNDSYEPLSQIAFSRFKITIKKGYEKQYETIFEETFEVNNDGKTNYSILEKIIVIDIPKTHHLAVSITPDYDYIIKNNPTHSLIHYDLKQKKLALPAYDSIAFITAPDHAPWNDVAEYPLTQKVFETMSKGMCAYTRDVGCSVMLRAPANSIDKELEYPDLRGLPIDNESHLSQLLTYLGFSEAPSRLTLTNCGWRYYDVGDFNGYVIVDQIPPYKYPFNKDINDRQLMFVVAPTLTGSASVERDKVTSISIVKSLPADVCNVSGITYIAPNNSVRYKHASSSDRIAIYGAKKPNVPNLIGRKVDQSGRIEGHNKEEIYVYDFLYRFYHPNADGETIWYQFPTHRHFFIIDYNNQNYNNKLHLFVPLSNDLRNFEAVIIPDLRGLTLSELQRYAYDFDLIFVGRCISSYKENEVADQFPRGGVWFIEKNVIEPPIYILLGNGKTNLVSKLLNYCL
ncbi:MAG: S8 family serine peptidase [Candidatus Methanomethylicaceae archaeon]